MAIYQVGEAWRWGGPTMRTMDGVVTLVQESRFQLIEDGGIGHLFILSHGAAAEPAQLASLQKRQARVRVRYDEATNLIAKIAHSVELCAAGA